jgi:hypothetical protein
MAIHVVRHMQAMPVNDGRLGQAVDEVDAHALATAHADDGRQHRGVERACRATQQTAAVAPDPGLGTGSDGNVVGHRMQFDMDIDAGAVP